MKKHIKDTFNLITILLGVLIIFRIFFQPLYIVGRSMEPTIKDGSFGFGTPFSEISKGDIVYFSHEGKLLIKRVLATPSEMINDRYMLENQYWVQGDSADSLDSRFFGPINRKDISGELLCWFKLF